MENRRKRGEDTNWRLRNNIHPRDVLQLLEPVSDVAVNLEEFVQHSRKVNEFPQVILPLKIRQTSVGLRKILLDGNGGLLKMCVENPRFHPLRPPKESAKSMVCEFGVPSLGPLAVTYADGQTSEFTVPEFNHTITIRPLYGVEFVEDGMSLLSNPFDLDAEPVKFSRWMNTQVLEIREVKYNAESLLRTMANREGAHTNRKSSVMGPVLPDMDKRESHSTIDAIKFGLFSYMQIFTLFTGFYVVLMAREMLDSLESEFDLDPMAVEMIRFISRYPTDEFPTIRAPVSESFDPLVVLGNDGELVGDYTSDLKTTMKIP